MTHSGPLLGCIADHFATGIQLGATLVRNGMRTRLAAGVPPPGEAVGGADAVVIVPQVRSAPGVGESLAALGWLRAAGCRQFVFAYGSTFAGTGADGIGPVADALVGALGCGFAACCPASPATGHTVYQGHLFVGGALLNESGLRQATDDPHMVRALSRQSEGSVGLIPFPTIERGAPAIRAALAALKEQGRRYAVLDALHDGHLLAIGEAVASHALVTGAADVAQGLPENFRRAGLLAAADAGELQAVPGFAAVLAGSCSRTTLFQVGTARAALPTLELDVLATPDADALAQQALGWAEQRLSERPVLISTAATPDRVAALQARLGRDAASGLVEAALGKVARGLVARGVRRMMVAGGQTGAAVADALGTSLLCLGREIEHGIPWSQAEGSSGPLLLAFKPGGLGRRDLFLSAFEPLPASRGDAREAGAG